MRMVVDDHIGTTAASRTRVDPETFELRDDGRRGKAEEAAETRATAAIMIER